MDAVSLALAVACALTAATALMAATRTALAFGGIEIGEGGGEGTRIGPRGINSGEPNPAAGVVMVFRAGEKIDGVWDWWRGS